MIGHTKNVATLNVDNTTIICEESTVVKNYVLFLDKGQIVSDLLLISSSNQFLDIEKQKLLANGSVERQIVGINIPELGGDTDSIACMAGALSGAFFGKKAIPQQWLECVREKSFSIEEMQEVTLKIFGQI